MIAAPNGLLGVTVLRMDEVFSPNGYSSTMRDDGRDVTVREPDGVHLNVRRAEDRGPDRRGAIRGILGRPQVPADG